MSSICLKKGGYIHGIAIQICMDNFSCAPGTVGIQLNYINPMSLIKYLYYK